MPNKIIQLIGPMESKDSIDFLMDTIIIDGGLNRVKDTISKFKKVKEIVGDNDSNVTSHTMTKKLARDKDFSDLEYALQITKEKKYSNVILNGFLGGRRDHEFSNILTVAGSIKEMGPNNFRMMIDSKILITNNMSEKLVHRGLFSIFTIDNNIISLSGKIKYPLNKACIRPLSSHGLSNEASGEFELTNTNQRTLIIFFED